MGMVCTIKRVAASDIDALSNSPNAASALMDDAADRDFPLEEVRMPGCLGLLLRLTPIKVTQVAERPKGAPMPQLVEDPDRMDIEVWDALNYFLTGTAAGGTFPAGFLVHGGKDLSTEDDETHLRLLSPAEVKKIDLHLQALTREVLRTRIDLPRMIEERILSKAARKGAPDTYDEYFEHLLDEFEALKSFISVTRQKHAGLLVALN